MYQKLKKTNYRQKYMYDYLVLQILDEEMYRLKELQNDHKGKFNEIYDTLIEMEYFKEEELRLICMINGWSIDTLDDCSYMRYGYRKAKDLIKELK